MKLDEVYDEMLEIANKIGVKVRKDSGKFRGGNCTVNDQEVILINKSIPLEARTSVLAKCLSSYSIQNVFMKPAVRDYIEQEQYKRESEAEGDNYDIVINN